MNTKTIAIIGAGNMGASLLGGLIATGLPANQLWITDPDMNKLEELQQKFHVQITQDNAVAIMESDVVILAVKPQVMTSVINSFANLIHTHQPLIISVAAGVREQTIQHLLGGNAAIVRCMPNTPALIRAGATALYANSFVTHDQQNLAESILRSAGLVVWLNDEKQMDAVTALSGSGPAYFFLLIEALQKAGEQAGLSAETARLLTLQTAYGASRMALESDEEAQQLRQRVTSKGGTTEAAIAVLTNNHFQQLVTDAVMAANKRSEELADMLAKEAGLS